MHISRQNLLSWGLIACLALSSFIGTPAHTLEMNKEIGTMKAMDAYPLITTPAVVETRDFYVHNFRASIVFEASWIVVLSIPGVNEEKSFTLAFMLPEHPSSPPGAEPFNGKGMIFTVQVASVDIAHEVIKAEGAPIVYGPVNEAWGQRRFMTKDPAGLLIDIVEQIAPEDGYWEQYSIRSR